MTEIQHGLEGVVAFETHIAEPDKEGGALRYRGVDINDLVGRVSFGQVWGLLVDNEFGEGLPPAVSGIRIRNVQSGAASEIALDGVFVAIGHDPVTGLFKGQLEMDKDGYLITAPDSTATSIPGVYAAGDVKDKVFRQAVTAAGMGCMAALEADRYLAAAAHRTAEAAQ